MTKTDMKRIIIGNEGPTKTDTHNLMTMKRVGLINGTPASELACMFIKKCVRVLVRYQF
jgi:hypothetical protein